MKKYKVIAEGDFDTISEVIPAIAFVGHDREKNFRATIVIEELKETESKK